MPTLAKMQWQVLLFVVTVLALPQTGNFQDTDSLTYNTIMTNLRFCLIQQLPSFVHNFIASSPHPCLPLTAQSLPYLSKSASIPAEGAVLCYYESWAVYRDGDGKVDIEDLNPSLCTHYIYAYAGIDTDYNIKVCLYTCEKGAFSGLRPMLHSINLSRYFCLNDKAIIDHNVLCLVVRTVFIYHVHLGRPMLPMLLVCSCRNWE